MGDEDGLSGCRGPPLRDAGTLDQAGRYANADHLYGIAAECMLKAIMVGLGAPVSNSKRNLQEGSQKVHIDRLWGEYTAFAAGEGGGSYLPFPPHHHPFREWSIGQRYAPQGDFSNSRMQRLRRREEVAEIAWSLQSALLDGII